MLAECSPGGGDVGSVLLAAHERGDPSMAEVQDNMTALLLAGHDSTAVTLTYVWYELSRHPTLRESLADEAETVVGNWFSGLLISTRSGGHGTSSGKHSGCTHPRGQ